MGFLSNKIWVRIFLGHPVVDIPYLFDCKPRLIIFFHHFVRLKVKGGLHFLFFTLSKGIHEVPAFLGYISFEQTPFAFCSLRHHVHVHHRKDYDEQNVVVVV